MLYRVVACLIALAMASLPSAAQQQAITVFAAASLKNALDDVNAAFTKNTGIKVVASYAATPALMKQVENGAPADVFASADVDWMEYGARNKLIKDDTRIDLLCYRGGRHKNGRRHGPPSLSFPAAEGGNGVFGVFGFSLPAEAGAVLAEILLLRCPGGGVAGGAPARGGAPLTRARHRPKRSRAC